MVKKLSLQVAENPVCLIPDIVYSQPPAYFGYTSRALKMHLRHEFWQPEIKEIILDFLRRYL